MEMIKFDHSQGSPLIPFLFTITLRIVQCLSLGVGFTLCMLYGMLIYARHDLQVLELLVFESCSFFIISCCVVCVCVIMFGLCL